jgi:hypothetical protein
MKGRNGNLLRPLPDTSRFDEDTILEYSKEQDWRSIFLACIIHYGYQNKRATKDDLQERKA